MDLRQYYMKIRQAEAGIEGEYALVASLETADGGRAGVVTEVTRQVAAKLLVEGRARLANDEERREFELQAAQVKKLGEQAAAAKRVQVTVLSESDLRLLRRKE